LFLDEVDAITPKRETAQREMERRIVAQLLTCFDGMSMLQTCAGKELMIDLAESMAPVIVIGATNRPDSLDPALRRAGRFDHEIEMGVPSAEGREALVSFQTEQSSRLMSRILRVLCAKMTLCGDVDLKSLARATPGYVGADLTSLATTASTLAIRRCVEGLVRRDTLEPDSSMDTQLYADLPTSLRDKPMARFLVSHPNPLNEEQLSTLSVSSIDFTAALKIVQPSAKREGFATVPETTWADIGALSSVREELHMAIVRPASHPELFASMGMDSPSGVLLWGPPGCGKTLLAKAVANESRTNFISVKGPELLNKVRLLAECADGADR
jgi:ribosome biogenesis ATPase